MLGQPGQLDPSGLPQRHLRKRHHSQVLLQEQRVKLTCSQTDGNTTNRRTNISQHPLGVKVLIAAMVG